MKLFWGRYTCAIGIHILLEETGAPFETERLDLKAGGNRGDAFRALNPKMRVPTLVRDDGSVLTEFGAIATWIALTWPDKALIPADAEERVRMIEIMDYAVGTLHGQAFRRVFRPADFVPASLGPEDGGMALAGIKAEGLAMARNAFAIIDRALQGRAYVGGRGFSIGDAALFYCEWWAPRVDIALPPNVAAHRDRMLERPSVRRALTAFGAE